MAPRNVPNSSLALDRVGWNEPMSIIIDAKAIAKDFAGLIDP
tara:strand:- start:4821 stop:4946 length:126 start_codon:yes stop_codon:yes gene_type:complete